MNAYFLGLIVFAFVGSVVLSLTPSGTSRGYVRLLCGLCSVGCVAFPLFGLVDGGVNADEVAALFEPYDVIDENSVEIYNYALDEATLENAEELLKSKIIQELSTKYEDFDLQILLTESSGEKCIDKIIVTLYPSGYSQDPKKIEDICKSELDADCEFIYR